MSYWCRLGVHEGCGCPLLRPATSRRDRALLKATERALAAWLASGRCL